MAQMMKDQYDEKAMRLAEEGVSSVPVHAAPAGSGIANPAPLGLLCFGMTTVMLMFITTGWSETAFATTVVGTACFYGGFGQMVAGVFEMIKGNTFAATAFFSYGAFWMSWFLVKLLPVAHAGQFLSPHSYKVGETLFLCLWGVFTFGFFIPTLRKNGCLMVVFGSLFTTFFLLAGGEWSAACKTAAGYVGFFCGSSAIYTAFAEVYQESLGINMPGLRPVRFI